MKSIEETVLDMERAPISDSVATIITNKVIDAIRRDIRTIDPPDDYFSERWHTFSEEREGEIELDKPNDGYCITYQYEISGNHRVYCERLSDPECCRYFDELEDMSGQMFRIDITTPSGDEVKQTICEDIVAAVNRAIRHKR